MNKAFLKKYIYSEDAKPNTLAIFVFFVAVIGVVNSLRFGSASLDYYLVRNSIETWQENGQSQSIDNYTAAKNAIITASTLHRANPLYTELSGQITEWGAISGFEQDATLEQAKIYYLSALKQRPLWPVTWANLALLKWRLQEYDEEMLAYLEKADQLGRQKAEVHLLFAKLGLSLYQANHPFYIQIKDTVQQRIAAGLRSPYSRGELSRFIKANSANKTVCRWMKASDRFVYDNFVKCPKS